MPQSQVAETTTRKQNRNRLIMASSLLGTNEIFAPLAALKQELISLQGKM